MAYIVQKSKVAALNISGVDYTSSFISFTVSDSSANRQGFVTTAGTLVIGQRPGVGDLTDYNRSLFKRGEVVTLDVTFADGSTARHPRGYLYVVSCGYDPESETTSVDLGCRITLAQTMDDPSEILPLVPITLDPAQQNIQNCASAFQSTGQYLYQNNQGNLVTKKFFDGDSYGSAAAGQWVSILGETALSVQPLALTGPIPDEIRLSYDIPEELSTENPPLVETVTTENRYFVQYPVVNYARIKEDECQVDEDQQDIRVRNIPVIATGPLPGVLSGSALLMVDGVTLEDGMGILLTAQANPKDNGVWTINDLGPWNGPFRRSVGTILEQQQGTNAGRRYILSEKDSLNGIETWTSYSGGGEGIQCIGGSVNENPQVGDKTGCGNTPSAPDGETVTVSGQTYADKNTSCTEGYEVVQTPIYVTVDSLEETVTEYFGPGGQQSRILKTTYKPPVEINGQFYADKYAYCAAVYASRCRPSGGCPVDGISKVKSGWTETLNFYAPETNELVKTTVAEYKSLFELGEPDNWRTGAVDDELTRFNDNFDNLFLGQFILYQFTETRYTETSTYKVQEVDTWVSNASLGVGIQYATSALSGIKTTRITTSRNNQVLGELPPATKDVTTPTVTEYTTLKLIDGKYITPPTEAGPYYLDESIPMPLLFNSVAEINSAIADYSFYIEKFTKGDSYGLTIAEALRPEIVSGWYPGMPFRYSDNNGNILALRMDGSSWTVNVNESMVATNGIWCGISNGTLTVPSNVVGNSQPDMTATQGNLYAGASSTSGTPTAPGATVPPSVDDETSVDEGAVAFTVDMVLPSLAGGYTNLMEVTVDNYGADGTVPTIVPQESNTEESLTVWVDGAIFLSGSLLATDGTGSIPLEYNGNIVTSGGTISQDNLFG